MAALDRRSVGEALTRLAFCAEILDDDVVDAKSCSSLAWTIRQLDGDVTIDRIATLDGVSLPILAVVDDVANERMPPLLAKLESQVPPGLLEVRRLKGLGPKKIRALWQELDVTSVGELEYACKENRLVTLKGFGKKTQDSVLEQIQALRERAGMLRLDHGDVVAAAIIAGLDHGAPALTKIAGDLRRRTEVVAEVTLVTTASLEAVKAVLAQLAGKVAAHAAGADGDDPNAVVTKPDVVEVVEGVAGARYARAQIGGATAIVRAGVEPARFGTALVVDTGSKAHVDALRERATARGFVLDEMPGADEETVYAALGLVVTDAERREAGVPLVERGKAAPKLIEVRDIIGSLHNHTVASDGDATAAEMQAGAADRGLKYLAITDHSQSAVYARGLAAAALSAQREELRALNETAAKTAKAGGDACVLVHGVESDILKDGALDYADDVLKHLEVVVASVHARFGQKGADLTARMVAAAKNAWSDIVGHPTGRLLLGRAPSEYDVSALLEVCAMTGCAVELNANPARLDLNEWHLAEAKERGLLISIAADAHAVDELDNLEYGVSIARRAGLTTEDVLNARPLDDVKTWLRERRQRAQARMAAAVKTTAEGAPIG